MSNILELKNLKKYYKTATGMLHAVDNVTFSMERGTTLGIVGESGCGKTTLGRAIVHLLETTDGQILFEGKDITHVTRRELSALRRQIQIIFQDPFSSLNPRMTVSQLIQEPFLIHGHFTKVELEKKTKELMDMVGLAERLYKAYPNELDGGRRQRITIAKAIALEPKFIVCDEPVSALDVSIQAQILNLMQDLQEQLNLTYIFITHDLSVVRHISDEIAVMYLGQIVEKAPTDELFENPLHPYTKALLSAIPVPNPHIRNERIILKGEIVSPIEPLPQCRFYSRCIYAEDSCKTPQELKEVSTNHFVACRKCL